MTDQNDKLDAYFFQLVISLQMAAMQNMGKLASPISGKIELNLEQARVSIEMLSMLAEKTSGNLSKEEKDLIDRTLFELRMNFVDESKKADQDANDADNTKDSEREKAPENAEEKSPGDLNDDEKSE